MKIPQDVREILNHQFKVQHHFDGMLDGKIVFDLRTSKGLPLEAIGHIVAERMNWSMDLYEYTKLFNEHQQKSRDDRVQKFGESDKMKKRREE